MSTQGKPQPKEDSLSYIRDFRQKTKPNIHRIQTPWSHSESKENIRRERRTETAN